MSFDERHQDNKKQGATLDNKMITIKDVAEAANVSLATVSRVINNSEMVKPERRDRVLKAIENLGYLPNYAARVLVTKKTETIGVIVNNLHDPFFYDLIKGFETGAQQTSYNVIFCSIMGGDTQAKEKYIRYLNKGVVDAVVLYGSYMSDDILTHYIGDDCPVKYLLVENDLPNFDCNKLLIDNKDGARIATRYLIENGHREIAHICGNPNKKVSLDRFNGFMETMRLSGLEVLDGYIQYTMAGYSNGYECMKRLIQSEQRPSAVFCSDDAIASYAIRAAIDMGLRVPQDISVMGFDNQKILPDKYQGPEITSMEQPLFDIGVDSIRILVDQVSGNVDQYVRKMYETTLIKKESVTRYDG